MQNANELAQRILVWSLAHPWHGKNAARLKARHVEYMGTLLDRMEELDEYAMNRAWAEIPSSERLSDGGSRIVCELLCCYFTATKKEDPK